jgi:hypothetical protein
MQPILDYPRGRIRVWKLVKSRAEETALQDRKEPAQADVGETRDTKTCVGYWHGSNGHDNRISMDP